MPHLSPMNWLLVTLSMWTLLLLLSTSLFFSKPLKFPQPKYLSKSFSLKPWLW